MDADTGLPLAGAFFDIYKDGNLFTTVRTNELGIATVSGVSEGYYEAVETVAPEGYMLDTTRHGIHVDPYDPATAEDPVIRMSDRQLPRLRVQDV